MTVLLNFLIYELIYRLAAINKFLSDVKKIDFAPVLVKKTLWGEWNYIFRGNPPPLRIRGCFERLDGNFNAFIYVPAHGHRSYLLRS